jgi:hypothetical protein
MQRGEGRIFYRSEFRMYDARNCIIEVTFNSTVCIVLTLQQHILVRNNRHVPFVG